MATNWARFRTINSLKWQQSLDECYEQTIKANTAQIRQFSYMFTSTQTKTAMLFIDVYTYSFATKI